MPVGDHLGIEQLSLLYFTFQHLFLFLRYPQPFSQLAGLLLQRHYLHLHFFLVTHIDQFRVIFLLVLLSACNWQLFFAVDYGLGQFKFGLSVEFFQNFGFCIERFDLFFQLRIFDLQLLFVQLLLFIHILLIFSLSLVEEVYFFLQQRILLHLLLYLLIFLT